MGLAKNIARAVKVVAKKVENTEPKTKNSGGSGFFKKAVSKITDAPNSIVKVPSGSSVANPFGNIEGLKVVKKIKPFPMKTFSTGGEVKGKKKKNSIDGCAIKGYTKGRR
jgi:hypothetical protein